MRTPEESPPRAVVDKPVSPSRRIGGIDAARGFALIGMIIAHAAPWPVAATGEPTLLPEIFSGRSAALFALLAGVSLSLITGGSTLHGGRRMRRSQVSVTVRAVLLLLFGLVLNYLPPAPDVILPYYAVYFLVGVVFVRMSVRVLAGCAVVCMLVGPVVIHLVNQADAVAVLATPTVTDLVLQPGATILSLFVTGSYPAVTWLAYVAIGVALGRLDLSRVRVQIGMLTWGAVAGLGALLTSESIVYYFGGFERLAATTALSPAEITEQLTYGGVLPADSWWWLMTAASHTNTPFSVVSAAGSAVFSLGACLLAMQVAARWLNVVGAAGAMTFTLYSAHVVTITLIDMTGAPVQWILVQVAVALGFGVGWRAVVGQGPLELVMSRSSKAVARKIVPVRAQIE